MLGEIVLFFENYPVIAIILATLIPFLELRASIPLGILYLKMNWFLVFLVCVITNIILGPVIYVVLHRVIGVFLKVKWIDKIWQKYVERTQKRIQRYVDRWGILGVAIFIGIPLPGSGSYSGALGSYLLGIKLKRFVIANIFGVLIAGVLVTIAVFVGNGLFEHFIKVI